MSPRMTDEDRLRDRLFMSQDENGDWHHGTWLTLEEAQRYGQFAHECPVCGALVSDQDAHVSWHLENGK